MSSSTPRYIAEVDERSGPGSRIHRPRRNGHGGRLSADALEWNDSVERHVINWPPGFHPHVEEGVIEVRNGGGRRWRVWGTA